MAARSARDRTSLVHQEIGTYLVVRHSISALTALHPRPPTSNPISFAKACA